MIAKGWTLLFHAEIVGQLRRLSQAAERARKAEPRNFRANANVKLLAAIAKLILDVVPADPGRPDYRLGNSLGPEYRNWFRVKFSGRFRLFFRYDGRARLIVFAWVNDEQTLRKRGAKSDPYAVFRAMLKRGDPPADWDALVKAAGQVPADFARVIEGVGGSDEG
jgi:toxin YhaV